VITNSVTKMTFAFYTPETWNRENVQQANVVGAQKEGLEMMEVIAGAPGQEVMCHPTAPPPPVKEGEHMMEAPGQKVPMGQPTIENMFGPREGILVKQTMKGCCCDFRNEFSIHEYDRAYSEGSNPSEEIMFAKETTGCCIRNFSYFAPAFRATTFAVWQGAFSTCKDAERPGIDKAFLTHSKKTTLGVFCRIPAKDGDIIIPCCCCLPYLETKDASGRLVGKTQYICDMYLCVPKFDIQDANGASQYRLRPDTCCAGCCILCKCGGPGGRCLHVPYYIRDPVSFEKLKSKTGEDAAIDDLWEGVKKACCNRNNYAVAFPQGITPEMKATILGAVFLLEMAEYEQE